MCSEQMQRKAGGREARRRWIFLLVALLSIVGCHPFAYVSGQPHRSRRDALKLMGWSAAAPLLSNALPAVAAPWAGKYTDPNHPGCKREIAVNGKTLEIKGTDGKPGCGPGIEEKAWTLSARLEEESGDSVLIDFAPKGGPKNLLGTWDKNGIKFPDGNKWTKVE
mmetsp:Transcript_45821/g.84013  ORF Transcript_45821/g.84013 Transcript_45821/m.84013 type:complete len:165 (+) Transcript_45821:54-548(+)